MDESPDVASRELSSPASALVRPTDRARSVMRLVESVLAGLAVVVAVTVGVAAALTRPATDHDPELAGVVVAVSVLALCWVLLGVGVTLWGRHLTAVDRERWDAEWARVEPEWTGRRQRTSGPDTTDPSMTG